MKNIQNWILILIILIYFCFATHGNFSFEENEPYFTVFNDIARSFSKLKLSFSINPPKELLELKDPFNPATNYHYRLHDAALYKNKFYSQYGLTPPLFIFLPYQLIHNKNLPENEATFYLICGCFIFSFLILLYLKKDLFPDLSQAIFIFSIINCGLTTNALYLLTFSNRQHFYHTSIACSSFLILGGVYFLLRGGIFNSSFNKRFLLLAGVFFALSMGTKQQNIMIVFFIYLYLLFILIKNKSQNLKHLQIYFLTPIILYLITISTYNYLRFENLFEWGSTYALAVMHPSQIRLSLMNFLPNLDIIFFLKPITTQSFPYITGGSIYLLKNLPKVFHGSPNIGIFYLSPVILFCFFYFYLRKEKLTSKIDLILALITIPLLVNLIIFLFLPFSNLRYKSELLFYLILNTNIIAFILDKHLTGAKKRYFTIIFILLSIISLTVNLLIAFCESPYNNMIEQSNSSILTLIHPLADVCIFLFSLK
jgi:hypothetical protein